MWYIGQDIVCIKTHADGVVKEGEVYTIRSLEQGCCFIHIDVGKKFPRLGYTHCTKCGKDKKELTLTWWLKETYFKPLGELSDISEILEHLEQENFEKV